MINIMKGLIKNLIGINTKMIIEILIGKESGILLIIIPSMINMINMIKDMMENIMIDMKKEAEAEVDIVIKIIKAEAKKNIIGVGVEEVIVRIIINQNQIIIKILIKIIAGKKNQKLLKREIIKKKEEDLENVPDQIQF
jgi:hypothetical protein